MMKNLDLMRQERTDAVARIQAALASNDAEGFQSAFLAFTDVLQDAVMAQAQGLIDSNDRSVLAGRGVRVLTGEETAYYNQVIKAMRMDPRQALTELDVVLPKTVIDTVFDDITAAHPLLDAIHFQNTGALVEWILSAAEGVAKWGELTGAITEELSASFSKVNLSLYKLSAFIPVAKAMLDLGPEWLDRYVRAVLTEALATGLEEAIVGGDGKTGPVGMNRKLTGAVDGVYPLKDTVAVEDLDPVTMGTILATLTKGPTGKTRPVPNLLMVVNPTDYVTKVFPATTVRSADGTYANNVLPYPATVVQSAAVPANRAIFGIAGRYFMGIGTGRDGKLEYSDEYKFLEDVRVYLIKLYGNGRALDENAFVYADISGLKPAALQVHVVNADEFPTV